jgi:hypothetical protein
MCEMNKSQGKKGWDRAGNGFVDEEGAAVRLLRRDVINWQCIPVHPGT